MSESMTKPREFWISEHGGGAEIHWDGPPNYTKDYYHAGHKVHHVREMMPNEPDYKAIAEMLISAHESIAANSCCDRCREAALVSRDALAKVKEMMK